MVDPATGSGDLRRWFDEHVDDLGAFAPVDGESLDERVARGGAMLGFLSEAGVMGRGWPRAWGGAGGTTVDRALVYDLLVRTGLDLPEALAPLEVLGAALSAYAPDLAAVHVPRVLAGHELWCQGFSEPGAGSDLASLRTRADRSTDGWVINGQKVWTSLGHLADFCGVLARTGTPAERHRGLTLFWVDMRAQGVSTRTIQTLTGEDEFAEVFLDDVVVDDAAVIGEVGQGWGVAMHLLQYERGMWAWQRQAMLHRSLEIALAHGRREEIPVETIGHAFTVLSSVRSRSARTIERLSRGDVVGPEVSIDKILLDEQSRPSTTSSGWRTGATLPCRTRRWSSAPVGRGSTVGRRPSTEAPSKCSWTSWHSESSAYREGRADGRDGEGPA